nr:hypothetical protein 16 [Bacillaceae bacterium]
MAQMMKCGHTAQGQDQEGNPVCIICVGITNDAKIVSEDLPNLDGRVAQCCYCSNETKSDFNLPFFEYKPTWKVDKYYCGCYGWD